jgi:Ca-activated chloride channel family protein
MSDGGGGRLHFERHDLDAATLEGIAAATGGRFFRARSSRDLGAVYAEIDALERVTREERPRQRRAAHPEPLLAAAGGLLLLEIALARVLARRLP